MDNGTMVESFKFLNYYQLAKSSHVSRRFSNLIRTHRHKLALLDVGYIGMYGYVANEDPGVIEMYDEELSSTAYNEWIMCNGYSKQISLESQIVGKKSPEHGRNIYDISTKIYQDPNHCHDVAMSVFNAHVELKDENWPVFQHFIRLLMDPFIYIRSLELKPEKYALSLLTGAMNPDRDRLQCNYLSIRFNDDTQKFIAWIKDKVRCDEFLIYVNGDSNYDEKLFDLFLTGALCTSEINIIDYDLSKIIVDLMQKFIGLKNRDEYQMVESILGAITDRKVVEELKRNCAEFTAEEVLFEEDLGTRQVIVFINNDIERKLTLDVEDFSFRFMSLSIKISNL